MGHSFGALFFVRQLLALFLCFSLTLQTLGQKAGGPDKLIEAVRYGAFSSDALECRSESGAPPSDPVGDAIKWTQSAIKTAKQLRTSDKDEQGRAAAFLARQTRQLAELEQIESQLNVKAKSLEKALKQKRLETAQRTYEDAKPLACDARYEALKHQLDGDQLQFSSLVSDGDAILQNNPRDAITKYEQAGRANVETPVISQKIAQAKSILQQKKRDAKAAKASKGGSGAGKKVVLAIVVVGLLGGLGYAVYLASQKKQGQ